VARARAEAALRESEARMRLATEAAQVGMWFWDLLDNRLSWTPICRQLFGVSQDEELTYARFIDAVHPEDRPRIDEAVERSLRENADLQLEYRVVWPDGSVHSISATGRCDRAPGGRPLRMLGVAMDVTARTEIEEARKRLEVHLRQSHKMEALGTLAGGIAHDFNNILTAVVGNLSLASDELPTEHPVQVCLAESRKAANRAADLVHRILAFSRPSKSERRPLDLRPVVEEASRLLRAALPTMIEIRTEIDPYVPLVLADATEIHQVLMNLGTNARDAMKDKGGVVDLRLERVEVDAELCRTSPNLDPGPHLRIQVRDTGAGIDHATLERIYEPFFTTKPPGQGTGLGLSVVHGIVRSLGGAILVSSEPGRGTSFDVYLPAPETVFEVEPKEPGPAPRERGYGERLLYVDDETTLVRLAVHVLRRKGYAITGATSGEEALAVFSAAPANVDLVITDLGMPGMSGLELARELLRRRPELPIILTSGNVRPEDEAQARSLGVREIVLKPHTLEQMAAAVRRHLAVDGDSALFRRAPSEEPQVN
jgi:PAS domain S-box-containing protein